MFVPPHSRNTPAKRARLAMFVGVGVAAGMAATLARRQHTASAGSAPTLLWAVIGLAIGAGIVAFGAWQKANVSSDSAEAPSASDESREDNRHWLVVIIGVVAGLLALGLFFGLGARAANAQEPVVQSAFIMTRGADTIVVERVTRSRSAINGDVTIKGQARMTFIAELAAGPSVPMMSFKAWGAGASIDTPPMQSGMQRLTADSAFLVVSVGGAERKLSKAISHNPLPILNNEFAMIELAIQRALGQKVPKATVPMFALSGGVQIDCTIEFIGADSAVFSVAGQENRMHIDATGRILGARIPSQNIAITRVDGPAVDKISIGRTDYGAPAGAPYTATEVVVQTPMGHPLSGTLTMPAGAKGKVPAVVTITGSGQQDRDEFISIVSGYRLFRQVADTLSRRGFAVLRLDDRAINGSGGDVVKATSADFADDIRAGIAFLRARGDIDGARIALVGHSEGGMIAPMIAASDAKIAAVVLMAGPAYTGQRIIDFQLRNSIQGAESIPAAGKDSALKAVRAEFDSTSAKLPWMKYFLAYDPVPTARKVKAPVFIMQGGTDQQVTPDQAPVLEQAFKRGGNTDVTMRVFKDRNHLFLNDPSGYPGGYVKLASGRIDGEVMGALADWLVARLKP